MWQQWWRRLEGIDIHVVNLCSWRNSARMANRHSLPRTQSSKWAAQSGDSISRTYLHVTVFSILKYLPGIVSTNIHRLPLVLFVSRSKRVSGSKPRRGVSPLCDISNGKMVKAENRCGYDIGCPISQYWSCHPGLLEPAWWIQIEIKTTQSAS